MAGGSKKKNDIRNAETLQFRGQILTVVLVIYLAWRIGYNFDSFGMWTGVMLAVDLAGIGMSWSMFKGIQEAGNFALDDTTIASLWTDLFYVSIAAMFCATWTDWGWLVYLAIPGYGVYSMILAPFFGWVLDGQDSAPEEEALQGNRKQRREQAKAMKR